MLITASISLTLTLSSIQRNGTPAAEAAHEEEELARQSASSPDAFSELYRRYLPRVYRYHLARTGHVQEAEDLTAQTFLAALERISTFRGQGSFCAWLFSIASHKLADHYRRIRIELPLEEADMLHSPTLLPEEAALQRLEVWRVARGLRLISPERAEAVVLCLFGGLGLAEAARVMGKSEAAVKMLVYRGICDLQERLAAHQEVA